MTEVTPVIPDPAASLTDWEQKNADHAQRNADLRAGNKTGVFDALAAAGVTIVVVTFDGYSDDGQIQNIEAKAGENSVRLPANNVEIASAVWGEARIERSQISVHDAIERLVYDLLRTSHGGWEDGDGAYGEFTFDVAERTITLDYNERHMESDHSQHLF